MTTETLETPAAALLREDPIPQAALRGHSIFERCHEGLLSPYVQGERLGPDFVFTFEYHLLDNVHGLWVRFYPNAEPLSVTLPPDAHAVAAGHVIVHLGSDARG